MYGELPAFFVFPYFLKSEKPFIGGVSREVDFGRAGIDAYSFAVQYEFF